MHDATVLDHLTAHWQLHRPRLTPHHGGMNSATWLVRDGDRRAVAKLVGPHHRRQMAAGLRVAAALDRPDLPTGAPLPTVDGRHVATVDGHGLGLLTWVAGTPLDQRDQDTLGRTLGRAHRLLRAASPVTPEPTAAHLRLAPWIAPAVGRADRHQRPDRHRQRRRQSQRPRRRPHGP